MPAKDRYHDTVVNALKKDGWVIDAEQVTLLLADRHVWVDIQARKASESLVILVEVKGFENPASPVKYLADAVGQYILYQAILDYLSIRIPLYLAVTQEGYNNILSEEMGQQVIRKANMKLVIFDAEKEEIVQWVT